ncbi:MAG: hypothetical protein GTO54_03405 [Nitrososphaeria archaeon]|nr:hypothetical protein [Nitrososphaeria archaeon]
MRNQLREELEGIPDIVRRPFLGLLGEEIVEVKDHQRPLSKSQVMKILQKKIRGIRISRIESESGFSKEAIKYVKRYRPDAELYRRGREVL